MWAAISVWTRFNRGPSRKENWDDLMDKILLIDNDPLTVQTLKELLANYDFVQVGSWGEGLDYINHHALQLAILDPALLPKDFAVWWPEYPTLCQLNENKQLRFMLISYSEDQQHARRYTRAGAVDYVIKPIDRPLLLQKISTFMGGSVERQLYNYATSTPVDVASEETIEELSEFGVTLKSARLIGEGQIISLFSEIFRVENHCDVLARCYRSTTHPDNKDLFRAQLAFVGVSQAVLKRIRSWLRQEYVRKKQQAG